MGMEKRIRRDCPEPHDKSIAAVTPLANLSLNSLLLHDWWLCRAHPRGLAVGGFECRGRQGQRVLCSAAIAKRHDATTIETADGITIAISGFINTSRTLENGFPLEFCTRFLFGFPYDWEEYAFQFSNEASDGGGIQASITGLLGVNSSSRSNAASSLPVSLDYLPAPRIRDLLMFSAGDSQNTILKRAIFDQVLQKLSNHGSQKATISVHSNMGNEHPTIFPFSADDQDSNGHKKVKVNQNHMNDNNISGSRATRTVESHSEGQSRMGLSILTPTAGVTTRSMTKLKYLIDKQEGLSLKSSVKNTEGFQHSPTKANGNSYEENQENKQAKNLSAKFFIVHGSTPHQSRSEPSKKHPAKMVTRSASRGNGSKTLAR